MITDPITVQTAKDRIRRVADRLAGSLQYCRAIASEGAPGAKDYMARFPASGEEIDEAEAARANMTTTQARAIYLIAARVAQWADEDVFDPVTNASLGVKVGDVLFGVAVNPGLWEQ